MEDYNYEGTMTEMMMMICGQDLKLNSEVRRFVYEMKRVCVKEVIKQLLQGIDD